MRKVVILLGVLCLQQAYAQQEGKVGINTEIPNATLEVKPTITNLSGTTNEGIIAPNLTKQRIANIATPVEGTLVYVTDVNYTTGSNPTVDTRVAKITEKGYYYYNNTEWVKAGNDNTDAIWIKDGNDSKLVYPASGYTIKYLSNGGNATYKDATYPSGSKNDPRVKYDWNILTEMNSFSKTLVSSSDIAETDNGFSLARDRNIFKINQNLSSATSEISSFINQTFITENGILEGKSIYNAWNNVEHFGDKKTNWLIGTYSSAALNGLSSTSTRTIGTLSDAVTNSDVATDDIYASYNRVRLNGGGNISRVFGSRVEIVRRNASSAITSNISNLYLHYVGYNGLGQTNYTGNITNAYDFYAEAGGNAVSKITNQYGFYINGANKINYLQGSLGVGTNTPEAKLDAVNNSTQIAGRYFHRTTTSESVPAGQKTIITIKDGVTTLEPHRTYEVILNSHGETYHTGSKYIVYYDNIAKEWRSKIVSSSGVDASIKLGIASSGNEIEIWHDLASTTYTLRANIVSINNYSSLGTSSYLFGLEGTMTNLANNIGVGVDTPTEKLDVNGKVRVRELENAAKDARPVYVNANGVLQVGELATSKVATTSGMVCDANNVGKMNYGKINNADGTSKGVFGFCSENAKGEYSWFYITGGENVTTGSGTFGSGL